MPWEIVQRVTASAPRKKRYDIQVALLILVYLFFLLGHEVKIKSALEQILNALVDLLRGIFLWFQLVSGKQFQKLHK